MIKAEAQITIYDVNDGKTGPTGVSIKQFIRYYKIAPSTAKPSFDGTWTTTEPPYDGKTTNSLYFTDKVVYSDGNVTWSPVSTLSSYEAAKQANNKADNVSKELDNLHVDGRNLLRDSRNEKKANATRQGAPGYIEYFLAIPPEDIKNGDDFYLSFEYKTSNSTDLFTLWAKEERQYYASQKIAENIPASVDWKKYKIHVTRNSTKLWYGILFQNVVNAYPNNTGDLYIRKIKLERGSKLSDWSPAPEDIQKDVTANQEENLSWRTQFVSDIRKENDNIYKAVGRIEKGTADSLEITNSKISALEQNADGFTVSITETQKKVGKLENELSVQKSYMTFDQKGLTIGSKDSPIKAVHTSSALNFEESSGVIVGSFSSNGLKTDQANVEKQLTIGKWAIVPNKSAGLDFRWIGGK